MFSSAVIPLVLAASALANVFITQPTSSSNFPAGQSATVQWQDDGMSPSLQQFGNASFAIYVGNAIQQTPLQTITASVDVSAMSSLAFTPDPTIGPNNGEYFIRVTSLSFKNGSSQYFAEAFSAKFSLSGMSGKFNASVQAEIDGQSTAPIGGSTVASVAPATTAGQTAATTAAASASASPTSSSGTGSSSTNGAGKPVIATGFVALVAALVGASLI